jgi:hemoglobin/transferrin/lactoferrin receptor protein
VAQKAITQMSSTSYYATPSYTEVNLGASWKPLPRVTVNLNVNNLLDQTYWRWSDVRGLADSSTVKDAYTAPGRNLQASVRYDF